MAQSILESLRRLSAAHRKRSKQTEQSVKNMRLNAEAAEKVKLDLQAERE